MPKDWQKDMATAMQIERDLQERAHELREIRECDIDGALESNDPIAALQVLALNEQERAIVSKALARVQVVIRDLGIRQRLAERNREHRAHPGSVMRST